MEKLIKRYFLAIAEKPIKNAIITGVVLLIICLVVVFVKFGSADESINPCRTALIICISVTTVLTFINVVVTNLATTSFSQNGNKIILVYFPDGVRIYKKPIWGKYLYQIIKLPNEWILPSNQIIQTNRLIMDFKVKLNKQIAVFRIELYFSLFEEFKAKELNTMLINSKANENFSCFDFCECIEKIFSDYNLRDGKDKLLEKIIKDWFDTPETKKELIGKIKENILFPPTLFRNTAVTIDVIDFQTHSTSFL